MMKSRSSVTDRRLTEIAELAEEVANEWCPGCISVDPVRIATQLDIPVLAGNYRGEFDGLLECRNGKFFIYYDSARLGGPDAPRVRFTLAHELGHWYIDEHRESLRSGVPPHCSWTGFVDENPVEREADFFAANLLMPRNRFFPRASAIGPNLPEVLGLADEFQVSRTSAVVRYVHANLYACAIVLLTRDGNISWGRTSEILADRVYPTLVDSIPRQATDTLARIVRTQHDPEFAIQDGPVDASTWFKYADGHRDEELLEEVVSLGRFGTLVFLSTEE